MSSNKNLASWFWIRDTKGFPSVSLTFASVAFTVTTFAYITSIFEKIGEITIRSFDSGACGAYFGTIMALYWGRKWTEAKYINTSTEGRENGENK